MFQRSEALSGEVGGKAVTRLVVANQNQARLGSVVQGLGQCFVGEKTRAITTGRGIEKEMLGLGVAVRARLERRK